MPLTRPALLGAALILASVPAGAGQPPAKVAAPPAVAAIPAATLRELLRVGAEDGTGRFLGIHKLDGRTSMLIIQSARQMIAFSSGSAASKGGRYNPPPEMQADLVTVSCGDEDLGERWDCGRLTVITASGRRLMPLRSSSGPKVYRNAMGSSWTAITSTATYRLADLLQGFTVHYAGTDGTEFTEEVSKDRVDNALLARTPVTFAEAAAKDAAEKAAAAAAAKAALDAEPTPPDLFVGTLVATDGGRWTVTSLTPGYTWRSCTMDLGSNSVPITEPLTPGIGVTLAGPVGASAAARPLVRCTAKGRRFEGPVPAEFAVAIERVGPARWTVRNLSDWGWSYCEASFGAHGPR